MLPTSSPGKRTCRCTPCETPRALIGRASRVARRALRAALLLREGRTLASGTVADVLTSDQVGKCSDHPVRLERRDGRWSVRARR